MFLNNSKVVSFSLRYQMHTFRYIFVEKTLNCERIYYKLFQFWHPSLHDDHCVLEIDYPLQKSF
jgi:hypothetical protein